MSKPPLILPALVVACLLSAGAVLSAEQERSEQETQMQGKGVIYDSPSSAKEEVPTGRPMATRCKHGDAPCVGRLASSQRTSRNGRQANPPVGKVTDTASGAVADIAYASGGIGDDDPMLTTSTNYNLHMTFALQGSGEYLADIKVIIKDKAGRKVLEADSPGPVFYAKLPSGRYLITADYYGIALHKSVVVKDHSPSDLHFHWRSDEVAADKRGA